MNTLDAIFTRRSIRAYRDEAVPEEMIATLLKVAMVAPSAMDERPWHFVVVQDREKLADLADRMEHCEMLREAPLGMVFCGDPRLEKIPGMDFWVQDCSACVQNVHLAAHAMGLGSVWVALHPIDDRVGPVRQALGVPDEVIPLAILCVGFPAEDLDGEDRYDDTRVHRETWGGAGGGE